MFIEAYILFNNNTKIRNLMELYKTNTNIHVNQTSLCRIKWSESYS